MEIQPVDLGQAAERHRAGGDDDRASPLRQAFDIALTVVTECQPGLGQYVDIMLQPIGNAEIPHRRGDQQGVERQEVIGPFLQVVPDCGLRRSHRVAGEQMIAAFDGVLVKRRQGGVEQVQPFDFQHRMSCLEARQQMVGNHP